jgi:hypothetical protein
VVDVVEVLVVEVLVVVELLVVVVGAAVVVVVGAAVVVVGSGPAEITMVTREPGSTSSPVGGLVRMTSPRATVAS